LPLHTCGSTAVTIVESWGFATGLNLPFATRPLARATSVRIWISVQPAEPLAIYRMQVSQ